MVEPKYIHVLLYYTRYLEQLRMRPRGTCSVLMKPTSHYPEAMTHVQQL